MFWLKTIFSSSRLLKHVIKGKIEGGIKVTGKQGIRRKQLLDDLNETRGYLKLKKEALYLTLCKARFEIGYERLVNRLQHG
jgi:hypothetical protein